MTLVAAIAVGVGLRVWVLSGSLGALDGDEAVWGLMARHVLDGEIPTFFWAQEYGGSHEVLLTSVVFAVAGSSTIAMRLVPLLLFAVGVWLVRRIGRETLGEPAATYAAAIFCVWPAYEIWKSTRAHGFYGSGLVLALLAVLLVIRLSRGGGYRQAAALGLVLGLGLWATPQVGLLALPALGWLVVRRPTVLRLAPVAGLAALLGALPWILWNVDYDWASFDRAVEGESGRYPGRLRGFATAALPTAMGLRVPFSLEWVPGAAIGWGLLLVSPAAVAWLVLRRRERVELLVVLAVAYPFLFALSPFSWLVDEPRYLVFLVPVLALLVAAIAVETPAAPLVVAALALLSIVGLVRMDNAFAIGEGGRPVPEDRTPLIGALDRAGVKHVLAEYELAYALTFETNERIVAAPVGQPRYEPHRREVLNDPHHAYAAVIGSPRDETWRRQLRHLRRLEVGGFALYLQ